MCVGPHACFIRMFSPRCRSHCTEQNLPSEFYAGASPPFPLVMTRTPPLPRCTVPVEPVIFSKFASSIAASGDPLVKPVETSELDFEVELAIIIGKTGRRVKPEDAMSHVAGAPLDDGRWSRTRRASSPLLSCCCCRLCRLARRLGARLAAQEERWPVAPRQVRRRLCTPGAPRHPRRGANASGRGGTSSLLGATKPAGLPPATSDPSRNLGYP